MKNFLFFMLIISTGGQFLNMGFAKAEDSTVNKVQDSAGDVKTDAKKLGRTTKRKVRKATGNDNVLKDVKDKANDAGDDISNSAEKAKRKTK